MSDQLPAAVQAQLDKAKAIQENMKEGKAPKRQPTPEPTPEAPVEAKAEKPKLTPIDSTPTEVVDPVDNSPAPSGADEATWEQRYKSFKGHADAELKRAHESVESMRNDNAELKATLKQMQEQMDSLANPPEPEPPAPEGATTEDIESFGQDMVSFVTRVSQKASADALIAVNAKIQGVLDAVEGVRNNVSQVDERATLSAEALFFKDLKEQVSDFVEINNSMEWKNWLQGMDMMSGLSRQELLSRAQSQLSVDRVAAIFNNFKQELGLGDASATNPPQDQGDLESQVSPPKSKSAQAVSTPSDAQTKVWTQAEISNVYAQQAHGKLSAEEFQALEMEINRAVQTGRVR